MRYEIVVGLEVHCQLATRTKLFCACDNGFTLEPNTHVCPGCLGMPGALPVLNDQAYRLGLAAAVALGCRIPPVFRFDRKHYFYPDLPGGYQISQLAFPVGRDGALAVDADGRRQTVRINRVQIEADAGKLVHAKGESLVDYNRAGAALIEIVSEPDLRSAAGARAYLEWLRLTLCHAGVSDCNMEEGNFRADANVSLRLPGTEAYGTRNEIKNMNSFRSVEAAIGLVVEELARKLDAGEAIRTVTWGYNAEKNRVFPMREKETAADYRYLPDPDLPPVEVPEAAVALARARLPELPRPRADRLAAAFPLSTGELDQLVAVPGLAAYFEDVVAAGAEARDALGWTLNEVAPALQARLAAPAAPAAEDGEGAPGGEGAGEAAAEPSAAALRRTSTKASGESICTVCASFPVASARVAQLIALTKAKTVNHATARKLFARLAAGEDFVPAERVEREGLAQIGDAGAVEKALAEAVAQNPKQEADVRSGKTAAAMWFVGQVMKAMKGRADPSAVTAAVAARFGLDPSAFAARKK